MAKGRKPVSVFGSTSKKELEDVSKQIMKKTAKPVAEPKHSPTPPKETTTTKQSKKVEDKVRLKTLYVADTEHKKAKINAARRGMKMSDYIGWLINQDI